MTKVVTRRFGAVEGHDLEQGQLVVAEITLHWKSGDLEA